jgi:hypothetical protein
MLMIGSERFALADAIWRSSTTPKCKKYMWLAAKYRIWMSDRRFRHGLQATSAAGFVCPQEEDTVKHILLHCVHAREVWFQCKQRLNIHIQLPTPEISIEEWWLRERTRFSEKEKKWFDGLVCGVGHALWKNCNAWCFGNNTNQRSVEALAGLVLEELGLARKLRGEGVHEFVGD